MTREKLIRQLIPQSVRDTSAYRVPEASGFIKLDAMENPYEWPRILKAELAERLANASLNRYPDPQATAIRPQLRQYMNIPDDLEILFGNGSDEIIALLTSNYIATGRSVCAPDPSFVMFRVIANQYHVPFIALPLNASFDIDIEAWESMLAENNPGLIFVPQPNNPTGNLFSKLRLEKIIRQSQALFVIDEAYTAFNDVDFLEWAKQFPNVVIMRTLSKIGLAGGRLGLLIGAPEWIREFEKIRLPYNINVLTQEAVRFYLEHAEVLKKQSSDIRNERTRMVSLLCTLGLSVWPSEANFVVVELEEGRARSIFNGLKGKGILVKCLDGSHPRLANALRLTVGQPHETDALVGALRDLIGR